MTSPQIGKSEEADKAKRTEEKKGKELTAKNPVLNKDNLHL